MKVYFFRKEPIDCLFSHVSRWIYSNVIFLLQYLDIFCQMFIYIFPAKYWNDFFNAIYIQTIIFRLCFHSTYLKNRHFHMSRVTRYIFVIKQTVFKIPFDKTLKRQFQFLKVQVKKNILTLLQTKIVKTENVFTRYKTKQT